MLSHASLQSNCDIKRPTGRHGSANTRHGDNGDIFKLDVRRWLRNEDQTLIQEVQETFVGLDRALDSAVTMVAVYSQTISQKLKL